MTDPQGKDDGIFSDVTLWPSEGAAWELVNDAVMGGVSESAVHLSDSGTLVFSGVVSLENNGGFASVRTPLHVPDLTGYAGLIVRARGDGHVYRVRLRTADTSSGVAYQTHFPTLADAWRTARLPFVRFHASRRGRDVPNAPPFAPRAIRRLGFMIADRQAGPFHLEIDWVKAYRRP